MAVPALHASSMEATTEPPAGSAVVTLPLLLLWMATIAVGMVILTQALHALVSPSCALAYWTGCLPQP
jgi:hypothetical protein